MKNQFLIVSFLFATTFCFSQNAPNYQNVSEQLLQNIKDNRNTDKQVSVLAKSTLEELVQQLKTDKQKIAFWVNIYNAFIQITLNKNPALYEDRSSFFKTERIKIAGELLSFDDVEHGIIRKSRSKISLGYLRKMFRPKWERELRVDEIDWRIHFALNCGAKSCPPVAIYSPKKLDQQLDFMATKYLKEQTDYNKETKTATTVKLISWFRADFGGISGAEEIMKNYKITPEKPEKLDFKDYDWTISLGNFRTLPDFN